jgi:hypothetical protein
MIEAKCEAERHHAEGDDPCDFAPESRPGHFRGLVQRCLQLRHAPLQLFDFPPPAKSESRQERHSDQPIPAPRLGDQIITGSPGEAVMTDRNSSS